MEKKKWIMLLFLGLFILPLMISVVSAQEKGIFVEIFEIFFGPIGGFFENIIVAKILLIALVAMLVYSIATFLPFMPESDTVKWAISIVVAVPAFLFVPLEDIGALLVTYEAMGVMLTSVVPFVIIVVFTFKFMEVMRDNGAEYVVYAKWINRFLLVGFGIYVLVKWARYLKESNLRIIYLVTAVCLLVWFFIENRVWEYLRKEKRKTGAEEAERTGVESQDALRLRLIGEATVAGNAGMSNTGLINEIKKLNKALGYKPDAGLVGIKRVK